MDRKGIVAVTLSAIVLVTWWFYNNAEMKKLSAQRAAQQAEVQAIADAQAKANPPEATPKPGDTAAPVANTPAVPTEPVEPEKLEMLDTDSVNYTFSTHGGGIARALLKKHEGERGSRMTLNEFGSIPIGAVSELASVPYVYAKPAEAAGGGEVTVTSPGHAKGQELFLSFSTGNLADGKWNGSYSITSATASAFTVTLPKGTLPESTSGTVEVDEPGSRWTTAPFTYAVDQGDGVITFEGHDPSLLHLTKKFSVPKSTSLAKDYIVTMRLVFQNRSKKPITVPGYFVHTGSAAPVHPRDLPTYTGFKIPGTKFVDVMSFQGGWFSTAHSSFVKSQPNIPWAAVADQYFTTLIAPMPEPKAAVATATATAGSQDAAEPPKGEGNAGWAKPFTISDTEWKQTSHETKGSTATRYGIEGAIGMPGFTLAPDEMHVQSFRIYAGPREYGRLRLMPDGEVDVLAFSDFGGIFGFFGPFVGFLSKILLFSLNSIHAWVGSYALAIIILTLIIKALLWPMQNKATRSAKRMQLLQPKMTEIREKYKEDPTRMNTEVMKLYKDYGVNPLSGCLPALVQMPVFIGLYNMLGKAVELRNSKFLWVQDLSQPDTVFHLPGLDFPVNVLPLCMAVTMLWQMMASPKAGDPSQQKMMMFMPVVFVMFCYNYASALALYLIVNNLVSVVQLYVTRNQAAPTLQKRPPKPKRK